MEPIHFVNFLRLPTLIHVFFVFTTAFFDKRGGDEQSCGRSVWFDGNDVPVKIEFTVGKQFVSHSLFNFSTRLLSLTVYLSVQPRILIEGRRDV